MTDAARRALRTFAQGFVATLALVAIPPLRAIIEAVVGGHSVEIDVSVWQGIALAAIAGGLIALISWGQNIVEDKTGKDMLPK